MKHTPWRRLRRYRRPLPPSPTRAQMRQRVSRLLYACQVEATREAQLQQPDLQHLENLNDHIRFFAEALTQLEDNE
jgi:hypothetical protein